VFVAAHGFKSKARNESVMAELKTAEFMDTDSENLLL